MPFKTRVNGLFNDINDVIQSLVVLIEKFPKACKNCQYG